MEFWNKISYAVQLLAACLLFMVPLKKKKYFFLRCSLTAVCLIAFSVLASDLAVYEVYSFSLMFYWGIYIVGCIALLRFSVDETGTEVFYCALCACGMQHIAYDIYLIYEILGGKGIVIPLLIYTGVYGVFYYWYVRKISEHGIATTSKTSIFPMATMVILIWLFSVLEESYMIHSGVSALYRILYRMVDGMCCLYVLWIQLDVKERNSLQRELDHIHFIWHQQKKQYQFTSETIESINRKCHDLKHQIRLLRDLKTDEEKKEYLEDLEQDIMIYDTAVSTGNKALDIVLMEKGMYCKDHEIEWSCMADGSKLDFMRLEDIYSIFGNALDNAIEAVMNIEERKKRVISVKIIHHNDLLVVQIQNYFTGNLRLVNGVPCTTKENKRDHGYGIKSILHIAEKYNGTITIQTKDQIFNLQILIPILSMAAAHS